MRCYPNAATVPETLGLSAHRTGRLETERTYAAKVPKLIASIKAPTTYRKLAYRESQKPAGGGPSRCRSRTPSCYGVPVGAGRIRDDAGLPPDMSSTHSTHSRIGRPSLWIEGSLQTTHSGSHQRKGHPHQWAQVAKLSSARSLTGDRRHVLRDRLPQLLGREGQRKVIRCIRTRLLQVGWRLGRRGRHDDRQVGIELAERCD